MHTELDKEMLKRSHPPKLHKWDVCHNRVFLPMTQDFDMLKFVENVFGVLANTSELRWTACFKLQLDF